MSNNQASIYTLEGAALTSGLQPSRVCDEAIRTARSLAVGIGKAVIVHDDTSSRSDSHGWYTVHPDGSYHAGGPDGWGD